MTPLEFMARLVALIPPPRAPLIHFHGVFAPRFRDRNRVVPATLAADSGECGARTEGENHRMRRGADRDGAASPEGCYGKTPGVTNPSLGAPSLAPFEADASIAARRPELVSPAGQERRAFKSAPYRIDWATLLHRVYDVDALACPCGGRLRFLELVTEPLAAREILTRLGLPAEAREPLSAAASRALDDLPPPDW